jgi:hypothetical protein
MNAAHFHLIVNHIPVTGIMFAMVFMLIAVIGRNKTMIKTSLWMIFIIALLTIPVYLSGGAAEEMMAGWPDISPEAVHLHLEAAEQALIAILVLGAVAAGSLLLYRAQRSLSGMFLATLLLFTIITSVLLAGAANKGGEIRHPEIRPGGTGTTNFEAISPPHTATDSGL